MELALSREAVCAALALVVTFARYGTYFWGIYKGVTKPHAFSWLIWGVMVVIGAAAQFKLGGGMSAWVLAVVGTTCLLIAAVSALGLGERDYTRGDWLALGASFAAIPVWQATDNPVAALGVLMVIDTISYYPTFRKMWANPMGEPPLSFFFAGLRYFFVALAVPEATWQTLLYPVFLMASDWVFTALIVGRRWWLGLPLHEYAKGRGLGE